MAETVGEKIDAVDTEFQNIDHSQEASMHGEVSNVDNVLELLERLRMDVARTSEKLLNFELFITSMSLLQNHSFAENGSVWEEIMENILVMDLSLGYFDSELDDLGKFIDFLMIKVARDCKKLSTRSNKRLAFVEEMLQNAEATLINAHKKLLEMKRQLGSSHRILATFGLNHSYVPAEPKSEEKSYAFCQKELLHMLDKSIAEEIDLQNKLIEMTLSKDELAENLYVTDQALSSMELTMELTWQRLLEAENSAEIFKEIAREMLSKIEVLHLSLNGSLHRENQLTSKTVAMARALQNSNCNCTGSTAVLNGGIDNGYSTYIHNSNDFMEKVKILEEKLTVSDPNETPAAAGHADRRFSELEDLLESMRHSLFIAESRADSAEAKLDELTESHLELTEELSFLRGSENNSGQKISLLEKQVRDLEKQLLHANASSESSHEQQNMLYSAIWDMETLIEDLKSKVSKAETKLENAEERCLMLAETNSDLNKEIGVLKSRSEELEASLKEGDRVKVVRSRDINGGAKKITDLTMKLAVERERVQKQLYSLARENRILMAELRKHRKSGSDSIPSNDEMEIDKETCSSVNNEITERSELVKELQETSSTSNQMNGLLEETEKSNEAEVGLSSVSRENFSDQDDTTATTAQETEEEKQINGLLKEAEKSEEVKVGSSSVFRERVSDQDDTTTTAQETEEEKETRETKDLNLRPRYLLMAVVIAAGAILFIQKREMFASYLKDFVGLL